MASQTVVIGISGASASGKSLLANTIVREVRSDRVAIIAEDCYYKDQAHLSPKERTQTNYDHPDAFDHSLLIEHLHTLKRGESILVPEYDFTQHTRSDRVHKVEGPSILVLEGIMLFADRALREMMDIRIYMDTALDICLMRRLRRDLLERGRDIDSVLTQYEKTVRPMYLQFIEPAKRHADVIVPNGGENRIAIDMIRAKIHELLKPQYVEA